MANNTMTLALSGDIPFGAFATAIGSFSALVDALGREFDAREGVEWFVEALERSSAIATIRGESEIPEKVEKVVAGFTEVGRALELGRAVPYSANVARHAYNIVQVLDGHITSVRFETAQEEHIVASPPSQRVIPLRPAYGALEGRIQTLRSRWGLRFTLYDVLYDRAVSCYLEVGMEPIMREAWGKRAIIEGLVTRDPSTGRPITIRRISDVRLLDESVGDYRRARGIMQVPDDAPKPEEVIRRLRDG